MPPNAHSISVAANTIHRAVLHADPLATLAASRWSLEGTSDFWAFVLQLATVAITLGVFVEVVATILEIIEDRAEGKKLPIHAILTLLGGGVVAVALGFEFWAEFKTASTETALRKNNAAAQGVLDKRARDATAKAVEIANKFGGLQIFVAQKKGEMDSAFSNFKTFAQQQQTRTTAAINDLNSKQAKLQTALSSVDVSAGKAASAADVASKTSANMTDTLNSEKQMEGKMREAVTPRQIDDAHFAALVTALKPFAKTKIDLALTRDTESAELFTRIADALVAAGWDIQPYAGSGFGLNDSARPDLPDIGEITGKGVQVRIAEADIKNKAVVTPGNALLAALNAAGLVTFGMATPDKWPNGKPNPQALKAGLLHLVVGDKP